MPLSIQGLKALGFPRQSVNIFMKVAPSKSQLDTLMHWFNFPAFPGYRRLLPITFDTQTERFDVLTTVVMHRDSHVLPVAFGHISGNFKTTFNGLTTYKGFPIKIDGICDCRHNDLHSMDQAPQVIGGDFLISHNHIHNMSGFPQEIGGQVEMDYDPKLPLLQTLRANQGVKFAMDNISPSDPAVKKVQSILNKYAGTGKSHILLCANELKQAGFKDNARW
jgi:hypothetical protein